MGSGTIIRRISRFKTTLACSYAVFCNYVKNEPIFKALDLIRQMHQNCGNKPGYGRKNPKKRLIVAIAAAAASASAAAAVGAPAPGTIRAAAPPI